MKRIGIFGGSFNPVHIGHLRFVIEVKERLGLDRVDLVPCANPPHKPSSDLLPFDLRFQMLADACRELDGIEVNDIESHLEGPSYTHRTLEEYRRREPDARPMFILGTLDLLTLPSWHRGPELTDIASIITVPRVITDLSRIREFVRTFWGERATETVPPSCEEAISWKFASGTELIYLPIPVLEISATLVRALWTSGRSLAYLVPPGVERLLETHRKTAEEHWRTRRVPF